MSAKLTRKSSEDLNYIMLSDDWEIQYWSEELGSTPRELGRLIDKYGSSAAKIRQIIAAMAEKQRKTEDDFVRENNVTPGESGQGKLTPQRKEQMPKSGSDGHVA